MRTKFTQLVDACIFEISMWNCLLRSAQGHQVGVLMLFGMHLSGVI